MKTPELVLTDPPQILRDARCPQCGAKPEKQVDAAGFGPRRVPVCGVCGYQDEVTR